MNQAQTDVDEDLLDALQPTVTRQLLRVRRRMRMINHLVTNNRCLEEFRSNGLRVDECFLARHGSLLSEVNFVSHEEEEHWLLNVSLQLENPRLHFLEARVICDVKNEESSVGVPIVHWRHGLESLLSRGVPELHFNFRVVEVDLAREKRGADCRSDFL